jgi:uncharacterized protein YqjF (DUF2071 family)
MNTLALDPAEAGNGRPLLRCDWDDVLFVHYEVDPGVLRPLVPFDLDLYQGRAHVSLVAFTLRNLRPCWGGALAAYLSAPVACHAFLNVRTYVRPGGVPGIYFLVEWVSNALAVLLGPPLFGLPYRFGRLDYAHHGAGGSGRVQAGQDFRYRVEADAAMPLGPCAPGSLDEFLLERYVAYTRRGRRLRLFRVWHSPWRQRQVAVRVDEDGLLATAGGWYRSAAPAGAVYSPGVKDVRIGRPLCLPAAVTSFSACATPPSDA